VRASLCVSACIATYSIIDSLAVKEVPLLLYIAGVNVMPMVLGFPWLYKAHRKELKTVFTYHKKQAFLIGAAGSISYVMVLWAFRISEAAYVVALREISVAIAAALGIVFLKEEKTLNKIAGVAALTAGALLLKIA